MSEMTFTREASLHDDLSAVAIEALWKLAVGFWPEVSAMPNGKAATARLRNDKHCLQDDQLFLPLGIPCWDRTNRQLAVFGRAYRKPFVVFESKVAWRVANIPGRGENCIQYMPASRMAYLENSGSYGMSYTSFNWMIPKELYGCIRHDSSDQLVEKFSNV